MYIYMYVYVCVEITIKIITVKIKRCKYTKSCNRNNDIIFSFFSSMQERISDRGEL